jgi:hypothetical protein
VAWAAWACNTPGCLEAARLPAANNKACKVCALQAFLFQVKPALNAMAIMMPMAFLRFVCITVLLLRIAAGGAWAMPVTALPGSTSDAEAVVVTMPCHMGAADVVTPQTAEKHVHGTHAGHAHCALCFPAFTTVINFPIADAIPSVPRASATAQFHWQRAPELRPPI